MKSAMRGSSEWSTARDALVDGPQPLVGTARCEHAHAGFLIEGALHFEFEDGCVLEFAAPAIVEVAPGHDAWVVGEGQRYFSKSTSRRPRSAARPPRGWRPRLTAARRRLTW